MSAVKSLWRIVAAIEEYAAALQREAVAGVDETYAVNVGMVQAGVWQSVVPSEARMTVRVGFPSSWDPMRAEAELRRVVGEVAPQTRAWPEHPPEVRCRGMRARGYDLPRDDTFARLVAEAHAEVHGNKPHTVFASGTTDARFYRHRELPALCYGLRARRIHAADECVELASIVDGARTLNRLLPRYFGS